MKGLFLTGRRLSSSKQSSREAIHSLSQRGFVPPGRSDIEPIPFKLPFDWSVNPFKDPNWQMQLHAWRMLDPLLLAYERDHDIEALTYSIRIASDWLQWLISAPSHIGRAWYDMAAGLRAGKLAFLRNEAAEVGVGRREVEQLDHNVHLHLFHLVKPGTFNTGNHGIFQANGLKALSYTLEDRHPMKEMSARVADNMMERLLKSQFDEEGVHREGAPEYHFFAMEKFDEMLSARWWAHEALEPLGDRLTRARKAGDWLCVPDGTLLTLGDTAGQRKPLRTRATHDSCSTSVGFANGYNIARSDEKSDHRWYLFFRSAYDLGVHSHRDLLSVLFWLDGAYVLEDPGKYGYKKDMARDYVVSESAHNGLHVGQSAANRREITPTENCLLYSEVTDNTVRWYARQRYAGSTVERSITFVDGIGLLIWDRAFSMETRTFRLNWTFGRSMQLDPDSEGRWITVSGPLRTPMRVVFLDGDLEHMPFTTGNGQVFPAMRGWVTGDKYRTLVPAPYAALEVVDQQCDILSLFYFCDLAGPPRLVVQDDRLTLSYARGDDEYEVHIVGPGKRPQVSVA